MATVIPDDALAATFLSSRPNGLDADDGLLVKTDMPFGNVVIDPASNAVYRALRRNIAVPLVGLSPEAGQFQYSLSFGASLLIAPGETVDVLKAAHAQSPAWSEKCECDVPSLPAGNLVVVKAHARLQMRAPTAAENGGFPTTTDGVGGRLGISVDGTGTVINQIAAWSFTQGLISVDQPIQGEVWLDPTTITTGRIRLHVLADGVSTSASVRFTGISQVWLQVEW